ncbi:MAG: hypothetical protein J5710_15605 [Treponema sp.]|nr:hypothetical protein [Treponema sp.]
MNTVSKLIILMSLIGENFGQKFLLYDFKFPTIFFSCGGEINGFLKLLEKD